MLKLFFNTSHTNSIMIVLYLEVTLPYMIHWKIIEKNYLENMTRFTQDICKTSYFDHVIYFCFYFRSWRQTCIPTVTANFTWIPRHSNQPLTDRQRHLPWPFTERQKTYHDYWQTVSKTSNHSRPTAIIRYDHWITNKQITQSFSL